jgi:hypothetical protein
MMRKLNEHDARRILQEAQANVERLKDSERRFAAERKASSIESDDSKEPSESHDSVRVETINQRHRREIAGQEQQNELERIAHKYEQSRQTRTNWSQWDAWCDARIAAALEIERRQVCTAIGEEVQQVIELVYSDVAEDLHSAPRSQSSNQCSKSYAGWSDPRTPRWSICRTNDVRRIDDAAHRQTE